MAEDTSVDSVLTRDNLLGAGEKITFNMTLKPDEIVVRGQALGYDTGSDKIVAYDSGGAGGAEVFYGLSSQDQDSTGADKPIVVWVKGIFLQPGIVFEVTADQAKASNQAFINEARALGIYLKPQAAA